MRLKAVLALIMTLTAAGETRILVHGHRGARAVLPENTLPAFEYAISVGVDMLELDLAVTKDNVLVVSHDPAINRKICKGPEGESRIRFLTLAEVKSFDCGAVANPEFPKQKAVPGTRIPTFEEVLALAPKGRFGFNVETKIDPKKPELAPDPETFSKQVVDAVQKSGLEKRVVVQSFDFRTLKVIRRIAPEIRLCALYGGLPKDLVRISEEAGGVPMVAPQHLLLNKEDVHKAHQKGLRVIPWTPNTPEAWDEMIKAGVDEIITDDPEALIAYLEQRRLR